MQAIANAKKAGVPVVVVLVLGPAIAARAMPWPMPTRSSPPGCPARKARGVADVLFGDYKPTGKLPVSWPKSAAQIPINVGDASYDPLFPYGFGLTY